MQRHKIFSNIVSRLGYAENRTDVLSIVEFTGDRLWLSVADANSELGKGWEEIEYRNPKAIRHRASKVRAIIAGNLTHYPDFHVEEEAQLFRCCKCLITNSWAWKTQDISVVGDQLAESAIAALNCSVQGLAPPRHTSSDPQASSPPLPLSDASECSGGLIKLPLHALAGAMMGNAGENKGNEPFWGADLGYSVAAQPEPEPEPEPEYTNTMEMDGSSSGEPEPVGMII
ncbi:hypothetical protein CUMW_246540 [Citrus unshiu]|nr:hypothetical protein CUMW_246540 [Citrus unshiu]